MPSEQARHKAVENAVKAVASGDPFMSRASNETPTGTIFELDLYAREGLERMAREHERHNRLRAADAIRNIAANLKPLIGNVMAQYCPDGQGETTTEGKGADD